MQEPSGVAGTEEQETTATIDSPGIPDMILPEDGEATIGKDGVTVSPPSPQDDKEQADGVTQLSY